MKGTIYHVLDLVLSKPLNHTKARALQPGSVATTFYEHFRIFSGEIALKFGTLKGGLKEIIINICGVIKDSS